MVKIALNLVRMRHLAIHTLAAPQSEKRTCNSACSSARQDRTPPEPPRLLHSALHHSGLRPHLGLGEQLDKRAGLLGPSSAHLQGQHHQTSPSTCCHKLRVGPCLLPARTREGHAISVGCSLPSQVSCPLPIGLHRTVGVHRPQPPNDGCPQHSELQGPCSAQTC